MFAFLMMVVLGVQAAGQAAAPTPPPPKLLRIVPVAPGATPPPPPPGSRTPTRIVLLAPGESPPDLPPPTVENGGGPALANLSSLFTQDDYPAVSLRLEEEGTVTARVEVAASGEATGCIITETSGSPSLDAATCRVLVERGQFLAAKDKKGRKIAGSHVQRVRWQLPDLPQRPFVDTLVRQALTFDPTGQLANCTVEAGAAPSSGSGECAALAAMVMQNVPADALAGQTLVVESGFKPGGPETVAQLGEGAGKRLVLRGVIALTIDAYGKVIDCAVAQGGPPDADPRDNPPCQYQRLHPFTPEPGAPRKGVELMAIYFREGRGS